MVPKESKISKALFVWIVPEEVRRPFPYWKPFWKFTLPVLFKFPAIVTRLVSVQLPRLFRFPLLVRFPRLVTLPVSVSVPLFTKVPKRFALPMDKLPEFELEPLDWLKFVIERVAALESDPFSLLRVVKL